MAFEAQHEVTWRLRKACGLAGVFGEPEMSNRADLLTQAWENQWPGDEPLSYLIDASEGRVRFHSLPAAKRYADSEPEYREILHRQRAIFSELMAGTELEAVVIVAADWFARDRTSGRSRRNLGGAWPWRIGRDRSDPEAPPIYFWVQLGIDPAGLELLLRAGADDQGRYLFTLPEMDWLFCPYDGGVDVFLKSSRDRDQLEDKFAAWLPSG